MLTRVVDGTSYDPGALLPQPKSEDGGSTVPDKDESLKLTGEDDAAVASQLRHGELLDESSLFESS